jgi:hypothetical protein
MYLLRWKQAKRASLIQGEINWKKIFKDRYQKEKNTEDPRKLRPAWVPDSSATQCTGCQSQFTVVRRRHHCRACGQIYCKNCCSKKMVLPSLLYNDPVRVCDKVLLLSITITKYSVF